MYISFQVRRYMPEFVSKIASFWSQFAASINSDASIPSTSSGIEALQPEDETCQFSSLPI